MEDYIEEAEVFDGIEEVKDPPASVYIRVNEKSEVVEVNSDRFITDFNGWIKIDEGYGDKYTHAQGNYFDKCVFTDFGYTYEYVNGVVREKDQTQNVLQRERRQQLTQELNELYAWFDDYDNQIKQYQRDLRLNIPSNYHIGDKEYTIDELDELAMENASRITNLRVLLSDLEK